MLDLIIQCALFSCITGNARDVAVDDVNGYIYWIKDNTIYRNDIDGSKQILVKTFSGKLY